MKKIFAISGSTRKNSTNEYILRHIRSISQDIFDIEIYNSMSELSHFNPDIDKLEPPENIRDLRKKIEEADGVLICTPEYVFSVPGSLKNLLEWCVSTTVFTGKPVGLITASASGEKGHEELLLIMKTLGAIYIRETTLLLTGIRGKIDINGNVIDNTTIENIQNLTQALNKIIE